MHKSQARVMFPGWMPAGVLSALMLLSMAASGWAQLQVRMKLEHTSLLQFEPVNAVVSIYNESDYHFVIGKDDKSSNAKIEFVVEKKRDEYAPKLKNTPPVSNFKIAPGEKGDVIVDISSYYDVRPMGAYKIYAVAYLNRKGWESNREIIDVVRGIEIAGVTRSVSGYDELQRTYALRYWGREKREFLFLCVEEEPSGLNYGAIQLGPLVRVFTPAVEVDRFGNVRVLHQTSSDCYIRSTFKSDGSGLHFIDQTYHLANGEPYPFKKKEALPPPELKKRKGK